MKTRNNKPFNENRPLAWAVFALVFVLSVVLFGGGSLRSERDGVMQVFHSGVHGDNLSIYSDLQARADCARNLAMLSARYSTISKEFSGKATFFADSLTEEEPTNVRSMVMTDAVLNTAVEALYTELENTKLSESDATFALSQYKEFTSRGLTISRDGYNAQAADFNHKISGFPANVVAAVSGVGPLSLFR